MSSRPITILLLLRRVDCNDGVASYCESIIKGLTARGDRVVIVSGPVTQFYGSAARHAVILQHVAEWLVIDDLVSGMPKVSTVRSVLAVLRRHAVDVISPQGFSLAPLAFVLSQLTRRPVVVNYHPSVTGASPGAIATSRSWKMNAGYRAIATLCTARRYIAISKDIADFFRHDCAIPERRIAYIPHGVDATFFRPPVLDERENARRKLEISDDALVCVLPGRLSWDKGHDVVIDAARILRAEHPEVKLVFLFPGGGDQEQVIREYAFKDDADADAFRFRGFLDDEAFRECYWAADIVLLPSRFEGFGLVIAEAMSCGLVPVRTPSGGARDQIVDGSTGFVIPFNDPAALADRVARLSDATLRRDMRERALAHAALHFDQRAMVAATSDLYHAIAGG